MEKCDDQQCNGQTTRLFVYGTLRRGFAHPMARMLALKAHYAGPGRAPGRLYWLGRYPGLFFSRRLDEWVRGDVYDLKRARCLLKQLDRYEGIGIGRGGRAEYERVIAPIQMDDGTLTNAWLYHCVLPVYRFRRIVSGDFFRQRGSPTRRGLRSISES